MLPDNILGSPSPDQLPGDVFLYPVCTNRENFDLMIEAMDDWYKRHRDKPGVIKDFLNAQAYVQNPLENPCLAALLPECPECPECPELPPIEPPELRINGDCVEWLNPESGLWECQLTIPSPPAVVGAGGCDDDNDECDECDECESEDCDECV